VDHYAWLRDREDPAVLEYLRAENAWTELVMAPTATLQETLYQEMLGRIQETDLTVPELTAGWLYYVRTEAGLQYPIHCRRRDADGATEEVLLDQNVRAVGQGFYRAGGLTVSPDQRRLAWGEDTSGSEEFVLHVMDLDTGAVLSEAIPGTSGNFAWAADSATLFYVILDAAHRPWRVWRHQVGATGADTLVYEEEDEAFWVGVELSRSRAYLFIESASHATSETRYAPADRPESAFRIVRPRTKGIEYDVTHRGDRFYLVTNKGARNFQLVSVPTSDPSMAWQVVIPPTESIKVDAVEAFAGHLVVHEREGGLPQVRIIDIDAGMSHRVAFPEPVYNVRRHANPEWNSRVVRFTYTSLVTPASVVDYDMDTQAWALRKEQIIPSGYDRTLYRSARLQATAQDGVQVPISLVWKQPLEQDGGRPMYLQAYGSYGINFDPSFSSHYLSLLDRGFIVGIAHVRGGEEMGRRWYDDGRQKKKRNTFTDLIACAEHLVKEGYTASDRLAISGGSAGGLLMGAVANLRPDLFATIVADVPFVDVVNTMLDPTLPLTVIEYDEWGNPTDDESAYRYMASYSPYDNVAARAYPSLLVTAGLNDPRVQYWEPAKWTAKLRELKTDDKRLLLRTNMGAGHAGASGRYDYLREVAFRYAFVLDTTAAKREEGRGN
jgi:oligopeptidase B